AIPTAMLSPVSPQARDNARQASCLSNMKQIGMAVQMYQQDYDGTCAIASAYGNRDPNAWPNPPFSTKYRRDVLYWYAWVYPYTKNLGVFNCPSETPRYVGEPICRSCEKGNCREGGPFHYGYNMKLGGHWDSDPKAVLPSLRDAQLVQPAQTMAVL